MLLYQASVLQSAFCLSQQIFVCIRVHATHTTWTHMHTLSPSLPPTLPPLCLSIQYYPFIEICIRACKNGGIDTKVHGITVIGRVDMNEDEVAANFSFLAMDETSAKDLGLVRKHHSKAEGALDTHNKVFVWGLNDRGQLGSEISETKVRSCMCM